jgi:Flp pilus assembly protein TadG
MGWVNGFVGGCGRFLARFAGAKRGAVAIIFALSLIPLLVAAGAAVDLSRALVVRGRLAQALDAAGLAVGATVNLNLTQMQDLATKYFNANYPADKLGVPGAVVVALNGKIITMTATAQLQTTLMYLVGINYLNVGVANEITRETKGLELAMVLDTTGSMASSGKIEALRSAATDLVNILRGGNDFPDKLKIGMVPFAMAVRLDAVAAVNGGWIDTTGTSSTAQLNFTGNKHAYWMYTDAGGLSNTSWLGCVVARPNRLDETDTAPAGGAPDTRWVPWFQPAQPNIADPENPTNPYVTDVVNTNQAGITTNFTNQYIVIPNLTVWQGSLTQNSTNISTGSDTFTLSSHGLSTAMGPVMVSSSNTLPNPLSASTNYWVIRTGTNSLKLATSAANASAGTAVNVTNTGSGTLSFTGASYQSDTLLVKAHGMATGDGPINLYVSSSVGTNPTGTNATTDYWAISNDANTIKLAASRADALSNTAVNFTANGTGTRSTSEAPAGTNLTQQDLRKRQWQKYVGRTYTGTAGPNAACVMQSITPLTNDMQSLLTKIQALNASGATNIPNGLGWGWRLMSSAAPYTDAVPYTDYSSVKAIVLMTDGTNDPPNENSDLNKSGYTPYGFAKQGLMGNLNSGNLIDTEPEMKTGLDEALTRTCNNIKAIDDSNGKDRIRIYTIALMVDDQPTIDLLQSCASQADMFFNTPSAGELQAVFQAIAQDLSNLRVSK